MDTKIITAIKMAKMVTEATASMPDYKVRNKALKAGREQARELLERAGYDIIDGHIYGYMYNDMWRTIQLTMMR